MIPHRFPESNAVLAMGQDEYEPIAVYRVPEDPSGQCICCFRLTDAELEEIARTRTLWISVLTFNQAFQPIGLSTQCPFVDQEKT